MKNINLKVPEAEHARMVSVASAEFIPLTSLLRRLFDQYSKSLEPQQRVYTHVNKRDKALGDYAALINGLSPTLEYEQAIFARETIMALRVDGGNIPHNEMPLPQSVVDAINKSVDKTGTGAALAHKEPETPEELEALFREIQDGED